MDHKIEFDEKCKSCKGTGLYVGMAERDGAAIVCHTCKGSGRNHVLFKYEDFEGRQPAERITRVFEWNGGMIIGIGDNLKLSDFGGMDFNDWDSGKPFPSGSEDRKHICPAWWYQSVDYKRKPGWSECSWGGIFSGCKRFENKDSCWHKWDEEYGK